MKKIILFATLTLAVGCTHFKPGGKELSEKERQEFLYDFASTNQTVDASYKEINGDLKTITFDTYMQTLISLKAEKAVRMAKRLNSYDKKEVRSDSRFLYVCVYSKEYNFGACDTSKCAKTELGTLKSSQEFESAFTALKNYDCNTKSQPDMKNISY